MNARTRLRYGFHHHIDTVACWLVHRDHTRAAELLWRACRMI